MVNRRTMPAGTLSESDEPALSSQLSTAPSIDRKSPGRISPLGALAALVVALLIAAAVRSYVVDSRERHAATTLSAIEGVRVVNSTRHTLVGLFRYELPGLLQLTSLDAASIESTLFSRMVHLDSLQFYEVTHTDEVLRALPALPDLSSVILQKCDVTAAGLKELKRFPSLKFLSLRVTNAGVQELAALPILPNLERIDLTETKITAADLAALSRQPRLSCLDLRKTNLSDADLAELTRFQGYDLIVLDDTSVTEEGAEKLRKLLPGTRIHTAAGELPLSPELGPVTLLVRPDAAR